MDTFIWDEEAAHPIEPSDSAVSERMLSSVSEEGASLNPAASPVARPASFGCGSTALGDLMEVSAGSCLVRFQQRCEERGPGKDLTSAPLARSPDQSNLGDQVLGGGRDVP